MENRRPGMESRRGYEEHRTHIRIGLDEGGDGPDTSEEDIIVTGLRRSFQSAQAREARLNGILDAIVAEDIGMLPIPSPPPRARVTGVQVTRGGGEAAGVQIRGLPDIGTIYNGRKIFTAEGQFV